MLWPLVLAVLWVWLRARQPMPWLLLVGRMCPRRSGCGGTGQDTLGMLLGSPEGSHGRYVAVQHLLG